MTTLLREARVRAHAIGASALTNLELLTMLLGDEVIATKLWEEAEGSWRKLTAHRTGKLPPATQARFDALCEIAVRWNSETRTNGVRIRDPADVFRLLGPRLRDLEHEEFHLLALDSQAQVLKAILITKGLLNSSLVHPREVFREAIRYAAAGVIVVHNHPSGDPTASAEDRATTRQLVEAGRLLDVPVYDHVIIAGDRWISFANEGML